MSNDFKLLLAAVPGSIIKYHVGYTLKGARHLARVRKLYDDGLADLVQRRDDRGFAYLLIFRQKPTKIDPLHKFSAHALAVL